MLTRKSVMLIVLGLALVFGGLYVDDQGSCVLGLMFVSFVLIGASRAQLNLHVNREMSRDVTHAGTDVKVDLAIEARGNADQVLEFNDELSPRLWLDRGTSSTKVYLGEGDRLEVNYRLYCPMRGYLRIGPTRVRAQDFFALSWTDRVIEARDTLTVYPDLDLGMQRTVDTPSAFPEMGQHARTRVGMGTEFFSMRHYLRGDPFRFINWKATARLRQLMVNEFEQEATTDVMVFVDMRGSSLVGPPSLNAAEREVELAASIVLYALERNCDVGMVLYGRQVQVLPPGRGQRRFYEALQALTAVRAGGGISFQEAFDVARSHINRRTRIIILTPLEPDITLIPVVTERSLQGGNVLMVVVEPYDFQAGIRTYRQPFGEHPGQIALTHTEELLNKAGIKLVHWMVRHRPGHALEVMDYA